MREALDHAGSRVLEFKAAYYKQFFARFVWVLIQIEGMPVFCLWNISWRGIGVTLARGLHQSLTERLYFDALHPFGIQSWVHTCVIYNIANIWKPGRYI